MNRRLFAATAALLAIAVPSAATANAATKKKAPKKPVKHVRTVTMPYTNPCAVTLNTSAAYGPGATGCATGYQVTTSKSERYMSVTITDATGQTVPVTFIEDGANDPWAIICGKSTNIAIAPNDTYNLEPAFAVGDTCPISATQGTITVKLSNLP
ncbi:MAG: hypothetical protein QOC82_3066 [Frankiaceae bacterium]|jgi:hypothetical protein|nr:hypothetical protein [Frankiaceae bacterium]